MLVAITNSGFTAIANIIYCFLVELKYNYKVRVIL
jgi:hypothetical protein